VLDSRKRNLQGPLGFCPVALLVRAYIGFLAFVSLVLFGTVVIYYVW